jgi:putative ABC transport system ATP-binding protein
VATLEARELVLVRGGRRILDGASLSVQGGEAVALEGPSGSGKSTLLRALATLVEPDSGTVLLGGTDARTVPPPTFRTRVAYLPQLPPMFDGTVAHNVGIGPSLRGEKLSRETIAALLEQAGLAPEYADRDARSLSGGETARVALARALANRPEVLLLDEPTASLDPETGLHVVALARSLAGKGLGVVMVTHVPEHAAALGGTRRLVVAGRIQPHERAA